MLYKKIDLILYSFNNIKMPEVEKQIKEYIETFNEKEKIAYKIAKKQLETSFNIEKSIGFIKWRKKWVIKFKL